MTRTDKFRLLLVFIFGVVFTSIALAQPGADSLPAPTAL
jgi:hypothetical protein